MLNNILFRSIIIDLMIRDQKRNKRVYKGCLEDLIYYLKKIDNNEFDCLVNLTNLKNTIQF